MKELSKARARKIEAVAAGFLIVNLAGCAQEGGEPKTSLFKKPPGEVRPDVSAEDPLKITNEQAKQMELRTIEVVRRTLPEELKIPAVVQANPNMTTPVASLVPGRVEDVHVQHGDEISKGQLLGLIRSDEVGQIESELISKLLELEAERKQYQVKMQLAEKIYERKKLLLEEKIGSRADLELAENELEQERAALRAISDKQSAATEACVQRLKLFGIERHEIDRVIKTREVHHLFEIRAPRSGVLTMRDADPGEIISAGKTLFIIADLSQVWLTAQLSERDVSKVKCGLCVKAQVEGYPNLEFPGHLNFIDSHIETETRTLPVRATIENKERILKPEMFGTLTIETGKASALFLPSKCIQQVGEAAVVYVRKSGDFYERRVETGRSLGDNVEILSGLNEGETVAEEGSLKLLGMALQRLSK